MDNTTSLPESNNDSKQQPGSHPEESQPNPQQVAPQPKSSGLKKIFIFVSSIIGAVILIGILVIFGGIIYFFHQTNSLCGPNSPAHKTEVSKVAVFNSVSVVPGQPNKPASIYDSTYGTCNLDVAQSYSASKSYSVNMNAATALSTITDNLSKQGFKLTQQNYSKDVCNLIWDTATYAGKSIEILVDFGSPNKICTSPNPYSIDSGITQAQFANSTVTSIRATVSSP